MAGNLELVKTTTSSSNADIVSITDCFTSEYDIYKVIYVFEDDSATYTPSRMPDMDVVETTSYKGILQNQAYGGKIYTNEKFGKQLEFELNYTNLSSSDRTKIEALFNAVKGQKETFQFSPDNGSTFHTVRFTKPDLKFTQTTYNIFSIGIVLRQEIS